MALAGQVSKLCDAKIQIVILIGLANPQMYSTSVGLPSHRRPISNRTDCVTHTNTSHVRAHFIQKWHHMLPFCDSTFEARVEGIAGEEGEGTGLAGKARVGAVEVDERLEARGTTNGFCRSRPEEEG
jgi:hypothetical protein